MKPEVASKLKNLIDSTPIEPYLFPVKKGNRINIGSYSIAKNKQGYSIKSYKSNAIVAETYTKDAAIAIAKNLAKGRNIKIQRILEIDEHMSKHMIDCMFYKHSLEKTKDEQRFEVLTVRYDMSKDIVAADKTKLQQFIF
jgi:hypothetical protein